MLFRSLHLQPIKQAATGSGGGSGGSGASNPFPTPESVLPKASSVFPSASSGVFPKTQSSRSSFGKLRGGGKFRFAKGTKYKFPTVKSGKLRSKKISGKFGRGIGRVGRISVKPIRVNKLRAFRI